MRPGVHPVGAARGRLHSAVPRYRLILAYDGTDFCGWQKQEPLARGAEGAPEPDGPALSPPPAYTPATPLVPSERPGRVALRTVQAVVERAVREVVREPVALVGASRTDSGVHARGQVAAFTCGPLEGAAPGTGWPADRGADRLVAAINSRLPEDVLVLHAGEVPAAFDPIGDCASKGYSYTFHVGRRRPLWDRAVVHHVWQSSRLDVGAMARAGAELVGRHDFAAFAAAGHGRASTVREVLGLSVTEVGGGGAPAADGASQRVRVEVSGNGFLWNMVRIIAGTLMEVGLGRRTPQEVRAALESRDRARAGPTAPPTGLCLEWVRYDAAPTADASGAGSAGGEP